MTIYVFTPSEEFVTYEENWATLYRNGMVRTGPYVLDTSDLVSQHRYGLVLMGRQWGSVNPESFPPKFRAHLLLLGVH